MLIEIRKRIPVAAGLAGGSADAAAALVACNELWRTGASAQDLHAVAAEIGSDVPFALLGGTAVGQGRGEQLSAALVTAAYHWVLAFAAGGLSTPEVYAACDRLRAARAAEAGPSNVPSAPARPGPAAPSGADARSGAAAADADALVAADAPSGPGPAAAQPQLSTALMAALRSGDPAAVGAELTNDLQPAAVSLRPDLRRTLIAGRQLGALGAMVSGSGPTCAFLAMDAAHARDLAVSLTGAGVCRSVVSVQGPVGGAAVLAAGEPA